MSYAPVLCLFEFKLRLTCCRWSFQRGFFSPTRTADSCATQHETTTRSTRHGKGRQGQAVKLRCVLRRPESAHIYPSGIRAGRTETDHMPSACRALLALPGRLAHRCLRCCTAHGAGGRGARASIRGCVRACPADGDAERPNGAGSHCHCQTVALLCAFGPGRDPWLAPETGRPVGGESKRPGKAARRATQWSRVEQTDRQQQRPGRDWCPVLVLVLVRPAIPGAGDGG